MGTGVLPSGRGLASAAGDSVPRSWDAAFTVFKLSDRPESISARITGMKAPAPRALLIVVRFAPEFGLFFSPCRCVEPCQWVG